MLHGLGQGSVSYLLIAKLSIEAMRLRKKTIGSLLVLGIAIGLIALVLSWYLLP
jgi:hypothetical protein